MRLPNWWRSSPLPKHDFYRILSVPFEIFFSLMSTSATSLASANRINVRLQVNQSDRKKSISAGYFTRDNIHEPKHYLRSKSHTLEEKNGKKGSDGIKYS